MVHFSDINVFMNFILLLFGLSVSILFVYYFTNLTAENSISNPNNKIPHPLWSILSE